MKRHESWTLFRTLGELLASRRGATHRLILLHVATHAGEGHPVPRLVEVGESGRITSIQRIRGDWA